MTRATHSLSAWKFRHALIVLVGIVLNLAFALPLLLAPGWILGLFGIAVEGEIWIRFSGGLLVILSAFYVPIVVDGDRFRILAWLAIFPSRTFGALYFLGHVLTGAPAGFLMGTLIDGGILIASLYCLIRIVRLEQALAMGQVP